MTEIAFSSVKVITGSQLPGVRGLWGHLLHYITVPFLVMLWAKHCHESYSVWGQVLYND